MFSIIRKLFNNPIHWIKNLINVPNLGFASYHFFALICLGKDEIKIYEPVISLKEGLFYIFIMYKYERKG
jgi:hypothetical protein